MKLLARFNLLFLALFALGMPVSLWLANGYLEREAEDRIRAQAELIEEAASATRHYTDDQVNPLLGRLQKREASFLVQSVPTYSVIQMFDYLHKANPQYTYAFYIQRRNAESDESSGSGDGLGGGRHQRVSKRSDASNSVS